jgi:hypothetical protein
MDEPRKGGARRRTRGLLLPMAAMATATLIFALSVVPFVLYTVLLSLSFFLGQPRDALERFFAGFTSTSVPVAASLILWFVADLVYQKRRAEDVARAAWQDLHRDPAGAARLLETLSQAHQEHAQEASSDACRTCVEILDAAVEHRDSPGALDFLQMLEQAHHERMRDAAAGSHPHYKAILASIQQTSKGKREAFPPWYRIW